MARLTPQGEIIDANPSFGRMLGTAPSKLSGRLFLDLLHSDDAAALRAGRLTTLKAGTILAELRFLAAGSVVWGKATITLARRSDDHPESLVLTVEDLTAIKAKEAALEEQRLHDPGTGLPNVTLLGDRLRRSIQAARRAGGKLAVLVIEIDRFDAIEEVRGPAAAQELLGYLAARLEEKLPSDSVARTSGNEVAIVLGKIDEAELTAGVGRRLLAALEPEFYLGDAGFQVKVSMGVALFPEQGRNAEALLRHARLDMYLGNRAQAGAPSALPAATPVVAGEAPAIPSPPPAPIAAPTAEPAEAPVSIAATMTALANAPLPIAATTASLAVAPAPLTATTGATTAGSPGEPVEEEAGDDLARRVELLEPVSLFLSLPAQVLRRIARYMSEQTAGAGDELAGPATPAALRIIHEGVAEVRTEAEGGTLSLLTLGPGDFMGVDSLFAEAPIQVHVRALTDCKLLVLDGTMMSRAAPPGSAFREALRQAAAQRNSHLRALIERPHRAATGSTSTQIAVYSTKGGSGRTTLALNLAAELGRSHPGEVLLIDMALPYNHVALLANLSPSTCLARIAKAPDDATFSGLAWSATLPHPAGFMALPVALRPEEAELVNPQLLIRALGVLAPSFRYVVFDLGVTLDDCVLATLELSDHLLLVATPELTSMHDTRQVIDLATRVLHIPVGRVHAVLNHRSPDSAMSRKVVEEVLGQEIAAEFRYFGAGPEMAALEGRLQVQADPGGHFTRSVRAILDHLVERSAAAVPA